MKILKAKVWTAPKTNEVRVYATIETEIEVSEKVYSAAGFVIDHVTVFSTVTKEGTFYVTGSHFQKPGSFDAGLSAEEWEAVKSVAYTNGAWHTVSTPVDLTPAAAPEVTPVVVEPASRVPATAPVAIPTRVVVATCGGHREQVGTLSIVRDPRDGNQHVLTCVSCVWITPDAEDNEDGGYSSDYAAPSDGERSLPEYAALVARIAADVAHAERLGERMRTQALADQAGATGTFDDGGLLAALLDD